MKLLSALGKNQILLAFAALGLVVNTAGNWFLMHRLGVAGIGLSTSLVAALSYGLVYLAALRLTRGARG